MAEPEHITRETDALKRRAKQYGFEVLTPAAVAALFGKSEPTVRGAARERRIETVFSVAFSGKEVRLFRLMSCIETWGAPDPAKLDQMREDGHVMFVANADGKGGISYNILHPTPLVRLEDAAERNASTQ